MATLIRQYENLPAEMSLSEINQLLSVYAPKFFEHIGHFGIKCTGLIDNTISADLGLFQFTVERCWDDESRNERVRGIQALDAVWVGLEPNDCPGFFTGMLLASVEDNWGYLEQHVAKVLPSSLDSILQKVGEMAFSAPANPDFVAAIGQEDAYEIWRRRAGLKDPGAKHRLADAAEAQAAAERAAQAERDYLAFRYGDSD